MNSAILPKDSIFHAWVQSLSITEIPVSYQIFAGFAMLGGLLQRRVYFDQEKFKIYPNMSVLFVGPSGIGKDTIINQVMRTVRATLGDTVAPHIIEGKTIELAFNRLADLPGTAWAFLLAPEITSFLGGRDYQKSMVQDITNLLSNNDVLDTSIGSKQRVIHEPTITMLAGSTVDWLHKAMPDGSMEGGFIPRFVVVYEEYNPRHVALIKHDLTKQELQLSKTYHDKFMIGLYDVLGDIDKMNKPLDMTPDGDAKDAYREWYVSRFDRYSPNIREYANRCRDQVLRFSMLVALSCGRKFISGLDMQIAVELTDYVASRVEMAIRPVTKEERIADAIRRTLPSSTMGICERLGKSFTREDIIRTLQIMQKTGELAREHERADWRRV